MKQAEIKLFVESYFDLALCAIMNVYSFTEVRDGAELLEFFDKKNIINSMLTIVFMVGVICLPMVTFWIIYSHFEKKTLDNPEIREKYEVMLADNRTDTIK